MFSLSGNGTNAAGFVFRDHIKYKLILRNVDYLIDAPFTQLLFVLGFSFFKKPTQLLAVVFFSSFDL